MFKKSYKIAILTFALIFILAAPAFGWADADGPGQGELGSLFFVSAADVETVTTSELEEILPATSDERESYEDIPEDWDFALVDTRSKEEFKKGHINGAINMPEDEDFRPVALPFELDKEIIFYGPDCHDFINRTESLGYRNVKLYEAGIEGWTRKGNYLTTTPDYVSSLLHAEYVGEIDNKPYQIIDTRGFAMYIESHIPTADSMEHTIFEDKYLDYISANKDIEIITYCGGFFWGHSHAVARVLASEGFKDVKVLAGGVPVWEAHELPLFGTDATEADLGEPQIDRSIESARFRELYEEGATMIDVRNDDEIEASGLIDGALHIPSGEINENPDQFVDLLPEDMDATIVIHCAAGVRARGVVDTLVEMGYENVYYLDGRITVNEDGSFEF